MQATYTLTFDPGRVLDADERNALKEALAGVVRFQVFGADAAYGKEPSVAIDQQQDTA